MTLEEQKDLVKELIDIWGPKTKLETVVEMIDDELNSTQNLIKKVFQLLGVTGEKEYASIVHASSPEWGCVSMFVINDMPEDLNEWVKHNEHNHIEDIINGSEEIHKLIDTICDNIVDDDEFEGENIPDPGYELKIYSDGEWEWD